MVQELPHLALEVVEVQAEAPVLQVLVQVQEVQAVHMVADTAGVK
jgi:hypothetical protein